MTFLKWCVPLVLIVPLPMLIIQRDSVALPLAFVAAFVLWRLFLCRFELYQSARILTSSAYVAIAAAILLLAEANNTNDSYWTLVGVAFTVVLAVRTFAQENFVRSRETAVTTAGRDTFAERAQLRTVSPPLFRWAHRVFALWWVWQLVTDAMQQQGPQAFDNYAGVVLPGFALLLGGPWVALFFIPLFFLALLFLTMMPGLLWLLSSLAWFFVASFGMPTDRRTNKHHGFWHQSRKWPWFYLT